MTTDDVMLLQRSIDATVKINCTDGEVIVAKIDEVDTEVGEVVYQMLSTTDESKYEKLDRQPAYLIHFHEIASVESLVAQQA
jgi:hypothetical protein